jgi:uncharacterized membrane protein
MQTRKLQGIADLAALVAARDLDHAQTAAQATADLNGWRGPLQIAVATGVYSPDPAIAPAQRFQVGGAAPNAATVLVNGKADLYFGSILLGKPQIDISRSATAARAELASFSIGTRLAALQGGVANQVLGALTGSTVSLSVMDYNALAGADVDLMQYSDALRTAAHLQGATFDNTLTAGLSTGKALSVLGDVLQGDGSVQAAAAARKLSTAAGTSTAAPLDDLLDLGPYGDQDHVAGASSAKIKINALDLADGMLMTAGGGRQVKLDLGASVPGITDLDVWLAIGERPNNSPWIAVDRDGAVVVRTAQTRIYVEAKALSALGLLGLKPIKLPLFIEAASGEAKLSNLDCPAAKADQAATLAVRPGLGRIAIGQLDVTKLNDFKTPIALQPADIVDIGIVTTTAAADVHIGGQTWKTVRFNRSDVDGGIVKTVNTDDIAQATVASAVGNLALKTKVLGGLLSVSLADSSIGATLTAIAAPLDGVVNAVSALAGVHLGQADVRVNGLRCKEAALVS